MEEWKVVPNRAKRRKNGEHKGRNRIRGKIPPHPLAVMVAANRIERQQIKALQKLDAAVPLEFADEQ